MRWRSIKYYYYYYYLCNVISDCSLKCMLYMGVCPCFLCKVTIHHTKTIVPLWCSDHHHQQQHHQYHHHHHRQYYHNHLIRITVILKVISQNVRFWVKPQLSKLGQLTLDRTLVTSQPDLASNCPNLSHKCARIFLNYRMDTFP